MPPSSVARVPADDRQSLYLADRQDAFARGFVPEEQYASISAGVERGLVMLRENPAARSAQTVALRRMLADRRTGSLKPEADVRHRTPTMLRQTTACVRTVEGETGALPVRMRSRR